MAAAVQLFHAASGEGRQGGRKYPAWLLFKSPERKVGGN